MKKYGLFYGSLRKGHYNFGRFNQKYIKTLSLKGYDLYDLGPYPAIVEGEGAVVVELHELDESSDSSIRRMELGAGYKETLIPLVHEGEEILASLYFFAQKPYAVKVESGDWSSHNEN